jgi:hypothetical protein
MKGNTMTGNSYYSRFRSLFEEAQRIADDLLVLTAEAKKAGIEDVATTKRLARLSARDKLIAEVTKYKKLRDMAESEGEQMALDV